MVDDFDSDVADRLGAAELLAGRRHLLWMHAPAGMAGRWLLVDGAEGEMPCAALMNDARSRRNNVEFTGNGLARATTRVPAIALDGPGQPRMFREMGGGELLVDYGDDYWRLHDEVCGTAPTRGNKRQRRRPRWHLEERRRPRPLPPIEQDVAPFPVLIPPSALAVGDGGGAAVGAALEGGGEPPA